MKRDLVALVLLATVAIPATGHATEETGAGVDAQPATAVQLRVMFDERDIALVIPIGTSATLTDHQRRTTLRLIPSIEPAPPSGEESVSLQILEVLDTGKPIPGHLNLLNVVLLRERGPAVDLPDLRLAIELVDVSEWDLSTESGAPGPPNLRPVDCCITCDGITTCSFCAWTRCGSCCAGP